MCDSQGFFAATTLKRLCPQPRLSLAILHVNCSLRGNTARFPAGMLSRRGSATCRGPDSPGAKSEASSVHLDASGFSTPLRSPVPVTLRTRGARPAARLLAARSHLGALGLMPVQTRRERENRGLRSQASTAGPRGGRAASIYLNEHTGEVKGNTRKKSCVFREQSCKRVDRVYLKTRKAV